MVAAICMMAVAVLAWELLWGKLFLYSPVQFGFSRQELAHAIVYVEEGAACADLKEIDAYPPAVERSHGLRFREKPAIYFFRDNNSYLQRTTTKARFCAYPNGSLVVSPWALQEARDGGISLEIYLKHELSHTLLYQHMGMLSAYCSFPRWLLEGVAMYHSKQMGTSWYPGKTETCLAIRQGSFIDPRDYATSREQSTVLHVQHPTAFMYSEFGCIVDDLITVYGKGKLAAYITRLDSISSRDGVFKEIFGIEFDAYLRDFRRRVMEASE